ncbi:MAG TPA: adenylate/guanylate cyclase domain-containing protein [Methylocystis sp.]|nr:adenylate/guanylate cyclase domain-containing protein [Methylocystis sp.]
MGDLAERRALAAMVMGDVVGYSRLMGTDEAGAVRRLKAYRTGCIDPIARAFRGRIVDAVGDSFFLEFASVVDATRGAIAIQQAIAERNAALPEEKRIVFRLGVNLGDVIIRDRSLFGDSVNIAARLQALAEPGGICFSSAAVEHIRQKIKLDLDPLGSHEVKNIARPIEIFSLPAAVIAAMPREAAPTTAGAPARRLVIAAGATGLLLLLGVSGVFLWKHLARQALISGLDGVLATSQGAMNEKSRTKLIEQYLAIGPHRALAIAPRAQNHWWTGDWPSTETAEEKALERCGVRFGEACEIVSLDDVLAPRSEGASSGARSSLRVEYAGEFDPVQIPAVRQAVTQRADVAAYAAAPEPKAAAIHPRGVFSTVSGAPTQRRAEIMALKACNDETTKSGDGDCFLYATGNKVVLPLRKTIPLARP